MEDKNLTCKECGEQFVFTAGEQEFFNERGFKEPERCKPCRDARKAEKNKNRPQRNDFSFDRAA